MEYFLDYILETNLFNFIIFLGIIVFICIKINVRQKLDNAIKRVVNYIEESKKVKQTSENELNKIEEEFSHIENEVEEIIQNSEKNADSVGQKIVEDTEKATVVIGENTDKIIDNNYNVLNNDLIKKASLAAIEVAKLQIVKELDGNRDLHKKFIEESLMAIEGVEL